VLLGLLHRNEASLGAGVPERRVVVVQQVRPDSRGAPGAARVDAGQCVLALDVRDAFRRRHGARGGERTHGRRELFGTVRLPVEVRLAEGGPEQRVVGPRDEVQRLPHHRRLDDVPALELALQRAAPEAGRARPDADVRRRRPLRLQPDETGDHCCRRAPLPLEQELSGERRAVQLTSGEHPLGHARTLPTPRLFVGRACDV